MSAEPIPAVLPLCVRGARGCDLAELHAAAFVVIPGRRWRGGSKKPRYGRR